MNRPAFPSDEHRIARQNDAGRSLPIGAVDGYAVDAPLAATAPGNDATRPTANSSSAVDGAIARKSALLSAGIDGVFGPRTAHWLCAR